MALLDVDPEIPTYYGDSCDWYDVPCHASSFAEWLGQFLLWIPLKIFDTLLDALAAVLEAIPLPVEQADFTAAAGVLSNAGYLAGLCNLSFGVTTVFACMATRFLIRRLPVIG